MTNATNTTIGNNLYPVANGTTSSNPFVWQFLPRNPTPQDVNFPIQKFWLNTSTDGIWFLKNFVTTNGVVTANWIFISAGTPFIEQFSLQAGISPVVPLAGIVTFNGAAVAAGSVPVQTDGTGPNTMQLEVQTSQAIASTDSSKIGLAAFNSTEFTVDANGFVSLLGGSEAIDSVQVDASTPPGTNPVVPTIDGLITVTGGQVAAGTTVNVIRTDSLAANTYTIEIQRSQAVASSTIGDNGVSHFDSSAFSVDGNGFVTLSGSSATAFDVQTGTSPVTPTAGAITFNGAVVAAGTHPVRTDGTGAHTMALEVQISQAIAATDATKIGLAAFDSARFTVDANGFVSTSGTGLAETITGQSGGALAPTGGNWNIFGGTVVAGTAPLVTSGSGSTLTINAQRTQAIASADTTKIGMAAFNSANFTVDANGFVSAQPLAFNYTNVNHAASPYTVLSTDYYISVDTSGGVVTLNFPNSPTAKQVWIVKDRTGNAATSNISITTPGGTVTFDGATTYKIISNYGAINLLANATPTYEVY